MSVNDLDEREENTVDPMRAEFNEASSMIHLGSPEPMVLSDVMLARPRRVRYKFKPASWTRRGRNPDNEKFKSLMYEYIEKFNKCTEDLEYGDFDEQQDSDQILEDSESGDYLEKFTALKKVPTHEFVQVLNNKKIKPNNYTADQYFGPLNNKVEGDCEKSNMDGCRMLMCSCNDGEDWFTGRCGGCSMLIPRKSWAIRYPAVYGGWEGCYCSKECIEDQLKYNGSALYRWQVENNLEIKDLVEW